MPILASGIALARLVGEAAAGRVTVVLAIPLGASGPSPDASLAFLIRGAPFMTVRRSVSGWRDAPFATCPPGKSKTPTVVQDPLPLGVRRCSPYATRFYSVGRTNGDSTCDRNPKRLRLLRGIMANTVCKIHVARSTV